MVRGDQFQKTGVTYVHYSGALRILTLPKRSLCFPCAVKAIHRLYRMLHSRRSKLTALLNTKYMQDDPVATRTPGPSAT
jgi:hypothetical protein